MFLMMFLLQSGSPAGADSNVLNIIRKPFCAVGATAL
jgi:hypothetical protein